MMDGLYSQLRERTAKTDGIEQFVNLVSTLELSNEKDTGSTIKDMYLSPSNILPWGILDMVQPVPTMGFLNDKENETYDYKKLVTLPKTINRMGYYVKRSGISGRITDIKEAVSLKEVANANASNSLSLTRSINTHGSIVSGSTSQLPFTPGGVTMTALSTKQPGVSTMHTATKLLHKDSLGLFDVPPGFERGIIPQNKEVTDNAHDVAEIKQLDDIDNELEVEQEIEDRKQLDLAKIENESENSILSTAGNQPHDHADVDDLLPMSIDFGRNIIRKTNLLSRKEWAHIIDLNHKISNFDELVPHPARTWPFELDTFQKEAVYHLEQGDSVFVAAHTSAGKTVVAEYAIAMSKRNMTKTIYTSPIKALSNQKFRDFKETFEDVEIGLITGDVQINPEASCLIMTTEILRSMLYRGADLIRDVEFVIFDEVHYVNDQDRGVVWEEVIIMLPQHVKYILLSATVPNTYEFANWIGRTKQKDIYVISTPKRPVPLEINIWVKNTLIPVINSKREFLEDNFKKQSDLIYNQSKLPARGGARGGISRGAGRGGGARGGGARGGGGASASRGKITHGSRGAGAIGSNKRQFFKRQGPNKKVWIDVINYLKGKDLLPAVIFVFSKKRCEEYADWLESLNFCTNKEKSQIHMFIERAITRLKKEDRELPQILKIRLLLERGIAVHHGGLLPIVKELIEMLFAKGLIKVLFATETFAMGLNLPTRTVIFSEIEKHDGTSLRHLTPGEFTQMAGRAGRRGLDDIGTVIIMNNGDPFPAATFREVTLGVPTKLQSQFKLSYNMILNLLRIEALKVEEMIKYSFSENTKQTLQPEHKRKVEELTKQLETIKAHECPQCSNDIDNLLDASMRLKEVTSKMMEELTKTEAIFHVLRVGRLIVFRDEKNRARLGFIFRNNIKENKTLVMTFTDGMVLENGEPNNLPYLPSSSEYIKANFGSFKSIDYRMEDIAISSIELVTIYTLNVSFTDIMKKDEEAIKKFELEIKVILKIAKKLKESMTERKGSLKVHQLAQERRTICTEIESTKAYKCPQLATHYSPRYKRFMIEREIKKLYHLMSDQNLNLLPDYEKRLEVLKDAGFIDQNHNVLLKGRVACEINSGYELIITELILDNFLRDFEPEEIVALLSVFIYEGRTREEEPPAATPRLAKGKSRIQDIYKKMLTVYETRQVPLTSEEAEFLDKKRFALMNVVYEWARGLSFKEIMEVSVEAEGSVVRVITRLDEICRQVKTAAIIIGNSDLHMKMSHAQELIKRDIVFAASLYL